LTSPDVVAFGIGGGRHEVERHLAGDVAHQVRQEDEGALQHRHQVDFVGKVAPDLGGHLGDARLNLLFRNQDLSWDHRGS
jgi:hypothetical protein